MLRPLLILLLCLPQVIFAREIVGAAYVEPTDAYGHGAVAGGEYAGLRVDYDDGSQDVLRFRGAVYEDTAPRLHDFDRDGSPEIVAVASGFQVGAMIQVYETGGARVRLAGENAPIGQRHRWLAIAGIADFDGDGRDEIAYVDRPHLAKVLRLVTVNVADGRARFTPFADASGLTNHHLGSAKIEGGVRQCPGQPPVVVTADADWRQVMETRWQGGALVAEPVGSYSGAESLAARLVCD